jgi:hypothetical protein
LIVGDLHNGNVYYYELRERTGLVLKFSALAGLHTFKENVCSLILGEDYEPTEIIKNGIFLRS